MCCFRMFHLVLLLFSLRYSSGSFRFGPGPWQFQNTISIPLNVIWIASPNYSMGVGIYNSL